MISDRLHQTPQGVWTIKGDTHFSKWAWESGRLDHDVGFTHLVASYITPDSVAIDVGANIGSHTIAYLRKGGVDGTVLAYEPNPLPFECLKRNCPTAICRPLAVGERIGMEHLRQCDENVGMSHLSQSGIEVEMTTLDHDVLQNLQMSWKRVSLIKIDVEGLTRGVERCG